MTIPVKRESCIVPSHSRSELRKKKKKLLLKGKFLSFVISDLLLANRFGLVFKVQRWGKESQF